MNRLVYRFIFTLMGILTMITMESCMDDPLLSCSDKPVEGLPATVTLQLCLDDMPERTRAFIDEPSANMCEYVWVGIYRQSDGKCTLDTIFDTSDLSEEVNSVYTLGRLKLLTESARSYIVAVANPESRYGISDPSQPLSSKRVLSDLLSEADTWEKFKNITAVQLDSGEVDLYSYDLVMSGYYAEGDQAVDSEEIPTVDIQPGTNVLGGAVYLRRLISYNRFNIKAADNVSVSLYSWTVYNNPVTTYLIEQPSISGDISEEYGTSKTFVSFTSDESVDGQKYFEFYQFENKHTACDWDEKDDWRGIRDKVTQTEMYADREREYKGDDSLNTGIYKSLVSNKDNQTELLNNYASYVQIRATVSYYIDNTKENKDNPEEAIPAKYDSTHPENYIKRYGNVIYTIHLGYCEGKDALGNPTYETAKDFRCYRNTKNIYNVTIQGLDKIIVEAISDKENLSGSEGLVDDVYGEEFDCDAHYCAFNISLTNVERNNMLYDVLSPYAGRYQDRFSINYKEDWENDQFYTWIKFKPTTDENTLAVYNTGDDNELWSLNDLAHVKEHPNGSTNVADSLERWYTVFIDEYVYHKDLNGNSLYDGNREKSWSAYVNQPERQVALVMDKDYYGYSETANTINKNYISQDTESKYIRAKYVITQRSIQTFYSESDDGTSSALGIEHINETFGLNLRWWNTITNLNELNGRVNLWMTLGKSPFNYSWNNIVNQTVQAHVDADSSKSSGLSHDAYSYLVPQLVVQNSTMSSSDATVWNYDPSQNDPNIYYANVACMNRNRDENGDGVISMDEMKWYMPTYEAMCEISMGQTSLPSPLMNWNNYSQDIYKGKINDNNGRQNFHYVGSDRTVFWAEEGLSKGTDAIKDVIGKMTYELRCVRNLGTDLTAAYKDASASTKDEIQQAYTRNDSIFTMNYYTRDSYRGPTTTHIPAHFVNSTSNMPSYSFQVAKDNCSNITDALGLVNVDSDGQLVFTVARNSQAYLAAWTTSLMYNSICGKYTQEDGGKDLGTWRVPNIKELTTIYNEKMAGMEYKFVSCTHEYFKTFTTTPYYYFFGKNADNGSAVGNITRNIFKDSECGTTGSTGIHVRCVRDVY